jgi:hypothetical protein
MGSMDYSLQKAREIRNRYEEIWMELGFVTAIGIGLTSSGRTGIIISLEKDDPAIRSIFPAEIEGIPIEVKITGEINTI